MSQGSIISLDTSMHTAPIELGPATGHRSPRYACSECLGDATGVGNSLQSSAFSASCGAIVQSCIAEAALSEASSSTCGTFMQENGQSLNGNALLFVDSPKIAHDGGPRMSHSHEQAPVMISHEAIKSLDTLVHAARFELGPATGHRSFSDEGSVSLGDATGVGNSLQPPAFIRPFGAIVKVPLPRLLLLSPPVLHVVKI